MPKGKNPAARISLSLSSEEGSRMVSRMTEKKGSASKEVTPLNEKRKLRGSRKQDFARGVVIHENGIYRTDERI